MRAARPAVLRRAAEIITTGGLNKGWFRVGRRHCVVGALMAACGASAGIEALSGVAGEMRLLAELLGSDDVEANHLAIYCWNDRPDTTAADVVELLDTAAEKAEANR